jgi:NitT/TauT family transport system substrate-binding protein
MKNFAKVLLVILVAVCLLAPASYSFAAKDATNPKFKIAWSHYTGWEPWQLANERGILKKWADKYGIEIQLDLINDYSESMNLYTAGAYDGCVMTNMDVLTIPSVGGIDSTALIFGDFSNGNDGIVMKKGTKFTDLKKRDMMLQMYTVSHYLLNRGLGMNKMTEKDLGKLTNVSDSDIAALFASDPNGVVVTWNPPLMQVRNMKDAKMVFDSTKIPGEIIDLMVVRTNTPDTLKKALVGAWYETMNLMTAKSKEREAAIEYMAKFSGGTKAEFEAQLKTTFMFWKPKDALAFATGDQIKKTMDYVRAFCFEQGLFKGGKTKDFIGIQFPDGTVMGDKSNVKLHFDSTFTKMAADGKL